MANEVKISALPEATSTTVADYVPIVQGGVTKKAALKAFNVGEKVSDVGLQAYWNMDSVPEIPDNPAGVTYLQDAWATVDGWTATSGTISVADGFLKNTVTGTAWYFNKTISAGSSKTFRLRVISPVTGTASFRGIVGGVSDTVIGTYNLVAGVPFIIDAFVAGNVTAIYLFQGGASIGMVASLDWIYIGTGAYLPNSLIDNSGNGNHGTIYGATPVDGISGKALAFASGNYVETGKYLSGTDRSYSFWVNRTVPANSNIILTNKSVIRILTSTIQYYADYDISADINVAHGLSVGVWAYIVITQTGTTAKLYKDGILIVTNTSSTPINNTNSSTLGLCKSLGFAGYIGTIDEPRIYNRALSAEEVYSLYHNKAGGPDCQVKSVTPVANSIMVRDASGITGVNGIKFPGTQVPSSDPNTLDDFEEGTFTPGISFGGAAVGITYTSQVGKYMKVGGRVIFNALITLSAKGSSTGAARITGLPFTVANAANANSPVSLRLSTVTFADFPEGYCSQGGVLVELEEITNAGAKSALTDADFAATSSIMVSGHYTV